LVPWFRSSDMSAVLPRSATHAERSVGHAWMVTLAQ
jgi:hypothetical protein